MSVITTCCRLPQSGVQYDVEYILQSLSFCCWLYQMFAYSRRLQLARLEIWLIIKQLPELMQTLIEDDNYKRPVTGVWLQLVACSHIVVYSIRSNISCSHFHSVVECIRCLHIVGVSSWWVMCNGWWSNSTMRWCKPWLTMITIQVQWQGSDCNLVPVAIQWCTVWGWIYPAVTFIRLLIASGPCIL